MSATRKVLVSFGLFLGIALVVVVIIFLTAIGRALSVQDMDVEDGFSSNYSDQYSIDENSLQKFVKVFGGAIKMQTVSTAPGKINRSEILKLHSYLRENFPLVFGSSFIRTEIVNNYSLLFTVKGSDPSLKPYMMSAHMDVVPVEPTEWIRDPFLGEVVEDPVTGEDVVWGRGTMDDKVGVIGILSALQQLLSKEWIPTRPFYVAFGHDEEVGGAEGAAMISRLLSQRGVALDFILDEGAPIIKGILNGIEPPVAIIGVSEKGRMSVRLSVEGDGGHSSIPPKEQAVGVLASAITKILDNPQPSMFGLGPEEAMLKYLAPKASWPYKLIFANTWLFGPILSYVMSQKRESNALIRTTTAVTMVRAGIKENVIPTEAWALINHRVHPAQTLDSVLEHDISTIADNKVKVEVLNANEPHPVSSYGPNSASYNIVAGAIKSTHPDVIAVPGILVANTDSVHYLGLTSSVYRFLPLVATPERIVTIHSKNERILVSNVKTAILFYSRVIRLAEKQSQLKFKGSREAGEL